MPLVSIILPNYNHELYLNKRIDSILNQTYEDFELIILDDCSNDNSREIIETYRSHRKVSNIVFNEINSGSTFKQWDKGIQLASGDYIWIAESDDYCEPTFLSELITPLINDNDLVISFCQSLFVTPQGKIINKTEADYLSAKISGKNFLTKYLLGSNAISNVSMAILKKDIIVSVSKDYKSFKYCGDWLLYANMCLKGNVFISGKYLNYYLRHENSVTADSTKLGYDFFEGNRVFQFIKSSIDINQEDIQYALNKRIERYFYLKKEFSLDVRQKVIQSLMLLDPSIKRLFRRKMGLLTVRKYITALKNKLIF
ncbi:MAG: glycosyltransferase [Chitinophagaceae bacterium]